MKKCLIIINRAAGGSKKITFEKVEKCLGDDYLYTRFSLPDNGDYSLDGYDAVAVCGGDGTLSSALGRAYKMPIEVYYFPVGTLNDKAKSQRYRHAKTPCPSCSQYHRGKAITLGKFSNRPRLDDEEDSGVFSYVLAAGSFTPIGYLAKPSTKKKIGALAYILEVVKQYRVHRINASISCGGKRYEGEFTLIMFVKSPRCFGFNFNRAFDPESISGHLVAIRSPKGRGLLGLVELFFPFFRVFFLGLKKERDGNIIFKRIYSARVEHLSETIYCRDGEKQVVKEGALDISFARSTCNFSAIEKF